ncbi:hypothetical protein IV494_08130 [Kaistella sp. G5-32]|uniref:Uncharacterized protein n=1 Tax=Kaistella gelatinilytica TaxID=2787636 RepID=A0ABS0FBQ5_9FLAO|nr:hypothetical protein [Kaistella gelatinilytica]MBF8457150.1 hypothetical protein [Kaistella gelatinilytica]
MQINNLKNLLEKHSNSNTLFISDHFFCLDDNIHLHFFYNPKRFWATIDKKDVEQYVIENLEKECAILNNVEIVENSNRKPQNYTEVKSFNLETPIIGNHYSKLGNQIYTFNSKIIIRDNYYHIDNTYLSKDIKYFDEEDLVTILDYMVISKTALKIKSVYELQCFKKRKNMISIFENKIFNLLLTF